MPVNIVGLADAFREWFAEFMRDRKRYLPADDQARLSWASAAKTRAEVPEVYREFFDSLPPEDADPFPYSAISPTFKGFIEPENEKLLCRVRDSLCILEQKDGGLTVRRFPLKEITLLETGTILLYSWFAIHGADTTGCTVPATMKFNSITEHLYAPFVEWFREAIKPAGTGAEPAPESPPFAALADVSLKFLNFGLKTVPPGEPVLQVLLQPEIRESVFVFLGHALTRRIAPAHLAILTERDLIVIRDDPSQRERTKSPYGGIWNYIPLGKIQSVDMSPDGADRLELSVHLPNGRKVALPYEETKRPEAEKLRRRIMENTRG